MGKNRKIVINVVATYAQTLSSVLLGLFASRWTLSALGEEAFGVFALVGAILSFVVLISNVLTSSVARFLAFALGETADWPEIERIPYLAGWFNSSVAVFVAVPTVLALLALPLGEIILSERLNVPLELLVEARWVYRFSIASTVVTMVSAPFFAFYISRQLIFIKNIALLIQSVLIAAEGYVLLFIPINQLVWHGAMIAGIHAVVNIGIVVFTLCRFRECRIDFRLWADHSRFLKILYYGGASFIGSLGAVLQSQGVALVVNNFTGVIGNASISVSSQISSKTMVLADGITSAVLPEITSSLAGGNPERAARLANRASFYSILLLSFLFFPLMFSLEPLLDLWLVSVPVYAEGFCCVLLVMLLVNTFSSGAMMLILAYGRIMKYQLYMGGVFSISIVVTYLGYRLGLRPVAAYGIGMVGPMVFASLSRIGFAKVLVDFSPSSWIMSVVLPASAIIGGSMATCYVASVCLSSSLATFLISFTLNACVVCFVGWLLISRDEKNFVRRGIAKGVVLLRGFVNGNNP